MLTLFQDWPGVIRASHDLADDFERATGRKSKVVLKNTTKNPRDLIEARSSRDNHAIIVGTIGESPLVDAIIKSKKIDVSDIEGKWEAFKTVVLDNPTSGVDKALVIIGADKRGSIYGIYDISEQIGVSPWYYWADVPTDRQDAIYAINTVRTQGPSSVKYRGIFLNDEQPALTNWNLEKYDGKLFDSRFYKTVFELLLRLRANFLWPAMWNSMFGVDDPLNQYTADLYGIVMSTSHTEPLSRATKEWGEFGEGPWDYTKNSENIKEFFREGVNRTAPYEHLWTMGMRGYHDTPLSDEVASELLETIVADQREILKEVLKVDDVTTVPQVWCLYKDIQSYYEEGMRVPDDIILLWAEDNWGNVRRLPTKEEFNRTGGAGVYYHFDYVGDPRDYKWINTNQLEKVWEQMHLSYQKNAREVWVVNVGDLKPKEIPIDFFMSLAYDFDRWGKVNTVKEWSQTWAELNFGKKYAKEVADLTDEYGKLAARRKYELLSPTTYSIIHYNEADNVLAQWKDLAERSQKFYDKVPRAYKAAAFELVLHPAKAGYIVHDIYVNTARNNLYADQRRNSANQLAEYVLKRFQDDHKLTQEYHSLLGGKWNHMMDQTHIGYNYWQQPMRNTLPPLAYVQLAENSLAGSMGLTVESSNGSIPGDDRYNAASFGNDTLVTPIMDPYGPKRWIEVFNKGTESFTYTLKPENPWVKLSKYTGRIDATSRKITDERIWIDIDWDAAPEGYNIAFIKINSTTHTGNFGLPQINVPINKTSVAKGFKGFVESSKYLSFEAPNFSRNISAKGDAKSEGIYIQKLNELSKTDSSVTLFPVVIDSKLTPENAPSLEYDVYVFNPHDKANITAILSPSLNFDPDRPLRYAIAVNDETPQERLYVPPARALDMPAGWHEAVADAAWKIKTTHKVPAGKSTIKFWPLEPGVVLHKVIVDLGGVKPSYLGPPQSKKL